MLHEILGRGRHASTDFGECDRRRRTQSGVRPAESHVEHVATDQRIPNVSVRSGPGGKIRFEAAGTVTSDLVGGRQTVADVVRYERM